MGATSMYYLALSVGFTISIVAFIFVLFSPKTNSSHFYLSNTDSLDPKIVKIVNLIGGDLLALLPRSFQKRSVSNKEVDEVFKGSGNPWQVTKMEFFVLRVCYAFMAAVISILFVFIIRPKILFSLIIMVALVFLGWNRPVSVYRKEAKTRETDFKKHFPEMLDYLTMIMSEGRYTFANAIGVVLPYLPESSVKREFNLVTDSIDAGIDTEQALTALADRVPTPALVAFVNAVNNANKLNTPMDGIMRVRAKKSREDSINDLELLIQTLSSKTMITIMPPVIICMLAVLLTPVAIAVLESV